MAKILFLLGILLLFIHGLLLFPLFVAFQAWIQKGVQKFRFFFCSGRPVNGGSMMVPGDSIVYMWSTDPLPTPPLDPGMRFF